MRRAAGPLTILLLLLALAGCSPAGDDRGAGTAAPVLRIEPRPGTEQAPTGQGLTVRAGSGVLTGVVAYAGDAPVPGRFDATRTVWRSDRPLAPGRDYSVSATATNADGVRASTTGRFRTFTPEQTFRIVSVTPEPGETVGVGMPIIVDFDVPVRDRAAVEKALEVRSSSAVEGAWRWVGETRAIYRPRHHWPAGEKVGFTAYLSGVRAAKDVYGTADHAVRFTVGRAQISTIDTRTHRMTVSRDGKVVQRMAISAGMATTREYTTTSGAHLTMDKANPVRMVSPNRREGDPGYYDVMIDHAVRISDSGEYIHAKDNVWAQGRTNVSHGCINARPDQAAWFYTNALRGDPVIIRGTDRQLEWDNGWGYWQLSWADWLKGSALHSGSADS
ncbi:L,D-transpeptidase [Planomonospora venezuelensis]|uniref:Lipoprotein-anchoring transpeptidase ErfK/SrfK n=1 Tax=Planomonospora venezuelensis TaxID=1999 RepID=A0A841DAJ4_PLAVE|nr:Ig-like domain-containing protein [Planomonospora venezuelensis]MBB5965328.1 lipoprotein-anchoring transpeptidase ErfK/SrfK [Planomonospora venezuelensis]GIN00461.1 lipoprotein [Planomonospora venezuelensis]